LIHQGIGIAKMMLKSMFFSMLIATILNLSISSSLKMMDSRACFGAGCYWGTEKFIKVDFGKRWSPGSIKKGAVGMILLSSSLS
jgi:hypothetical protein